MPISPEQALFIAQYTLPTLKNEHQLTLRAIQAIPPDHDTYRPDPISRSARDLAWHLASTEIMFLAGIANGSFRSPGTAAANNVTNSAETANWYESEFAMNLERLKALSGDDWLKILDFAGIFQLPAFAYLTFAINHSIHHRGQLSTYFRAMGAKVPSIYGQSYDDASAGRGA